MKNIRRIFLFITVLLVCFGFSASMFAQKVVVCGVLIISLDEEYFKGKSGEDTEKKIREFVDNDLKNTQGLDDIKIFRITDKNLYYSFSYKGILSKDIIEQIESDPLVQKGASDLSYGTVHVIHFKKAIYKEVVEDFINRHPILAPQRNSQIPSLDRGLQSIELWVYEVPGGREEEYMKLLKDKFPQKIKTIRLYYEHLGE